MLRSAISTERIIDECRQQYINIMPKYTNSHPQNIHKPIQAIFRKQEVKEVMKQLSVLLQLTIQNCVLTSDPRVKNQSYRIIVNLRNLLARDFGQFQGMISQGRGKLPQYLVDCKDILNRQIMLQIPPQVSLYQDPLLFYNYSKVVQQQLLCTHSKQVTRNEKIQLIKKHIPFFDPLYIPIIAQRLQSKAKFSEFQDRAILIMLKSLGKRQLSKLKHIYFPNRPEQQIRNRIKNLYAKQYENPIKQWRRKQLMALTEQQRKLVVMGYKKYGPRWAVISKYLQVRSEELLQADYNQCPKLKKRRAKQNLIAEYISIKKDIEQSMQNNSIDEEDQIQQSIIQERVPFIELEDYSKYKIINHQTFLFEEI